MVKLQEIRNFLNIRSSVACNSGEILKERKVEFKPYLSEQ